MIKLVVTDMDGTLFNRNSEISEGNVRAIRRLKEAGAEFAIASGRDRASLSPIVDRYGIRCEMILGNGAQYVDRDGKILMSCYLDRQVFLKVIALLTAERVNYMIFTTKGFFTGCDPQTARQAFIDRGIRRFGRCQEDYEAGGHLEDMPANQLVKVDDFEEFITRDLDIIKVEAFAMEPKHVLEVNRKLAEIEGVAYLSSFDDNIEITDRDAQKGLILKKVTALKGLADDEVMVLGDGLNDITMFQCFPAHSCAPANADPEIRRLAHRVVSSNEEDGFAEAVRLEFSEEEARTTGREN